MNGTEQRTDDWHEARAGVITGSRMADVLRFSRAYMRDIIEARAGNFTPARSGQSYATQWGIDHEPAAIAAYELRTGTEVNPGLLVDKPIEPTLYDKTGQPIMRGTPDGFVNFCDSDDVRSGFVVDGLLEVKCPEDPGNHTYYRMQAEPPAEHVPQMNAYMLLTGAPWCDFVSFDPRVPPPGDLHIIRLPRSAETMKRYRETILKFWRHIEAGELPADIELESKPPKLF